MTSDYASSNKYVSMIVSRDDSGPP